MQDQPPAREADGVVWRPSPAYIEGSHLKRLMDRHGIDSFEALLRRSVEDLAWFWDAVVKDLDIRFFTPYQRVLDTSRGIPWARWFEGGSLNMAYNCLDKHLDTPRRHKLALIWEGEDGQTVKLTYRELYSEVNRFAHALAGLGIGPGDRVGIFLPMVPEATIAVLACMRIGAVFTPIFSGYGAAAVASRLTDCGARLLITADGVHRRGRPIAMKEVADEAAALAPSVEHVVVVRRLGRDVPWQEGRDLWWHDAVAGRPTHFECARTSAEDPFMVIYTSGTTGRPKGAVHVHGGFPLKTAQDMAHSFDLRETDILFWLTDLGWMMGPWAILGTLLLGSTLLMYDGTPDYPGPDRLWAMVARHGVSVLGISPTVIRALMPQGVEQARKHDLSGVRILGGTGEPWNPDPYMWFFEHIGGGRCPLINYSGGTECSGGIISCFPLTPLKPCSFAGPLPGMDADVFDEQGRPVRGAVGELVIKQPWPGMTRGFWQDPDRYVDAYWSRWENVWVHGDWAVIDEDGFWFIQGRSDDTINTAGKRVGPAEIESVLVAHPAVAEAAVIGVPHDIKGTAVVGFVILRPGHTPDEALREALKEQVAAYMGKSLKPEEVRFVKDLPRTRNAKIMRRVVRASYMGQDAGDVSSLENPDAVQEIGRAL